MTDLLGRRGSADDGTTPGARLFGRPLRRSVSGEGRGIFCAMGSCHECRAVVDGHRGVRTCQLASGVEVTVEEESLVTPEEIQNASADPPELEEIETDFLVVGAGPAGIAAAVTAGEAGIDVVVIDEGPAPGGRIWSGPRKLPASGRELLERAKKAGVRFIANATVLSGTRGGLQAVSVDGQVAIHLGHRQLLLATGSRELFLPFPGWTLPGVVGVGGLQALIKGGLDVRGKRVGIAGSGPLLLEVAALARRRGAKVLFLLEQARIESRIPLVFSLMSRPRRMLQGWKMMKELIGVPIQHGAWVCTAEGEDRLEGVTIHSPSSDRREDLDILACGFGLVTETRIARGLGCGVDGDGAVIVDENCGTTVEGIFAAGEPTGIGGVDKALAEGSMAGLHVAGRQIPWSLRRRVSRERAWGSSLEKSFPLDGRLRGLAEGEVILCRCEDVTCGTVADSRSLREAKLLHRLGMGVCQGRVCFPAGRFLHQWQPDRVRPPWNVPPGWSP